MMRAQRDGGFVFVSRACPRDLAFQEMAGFYSRYSNRSAPASVCSTFALESRREPRHAPNTACANHSVRCARPLEHNKGPDSFWVIHPHIKHQSNLVLFSSQQKQTQLETSATSIRPISIALIPTELVLT